MYNDAWYDDRWDEKRYLVPRRKEYDPRACDGEIPDDNDDEDDWDDEQYE